MNLFTLRYSHIRYLIGYLSPFNILNWGSGGVTTTGSYFFAELFLSGFVDAAYEGLSFLFGLDSTLGLVSRIGSSSSSSYGLVFFFEGAGPFLD